MWSILGSLVLGVAIGYFIHFSDNGKKINGKLQIVGVVILIFLMGISIGANKTVIANLKQIGKVSMIFAITTTIFSLLVVYLGTKYLLERGE